MLEMKGVLVLRHVHIIVIGQVQGVGFRYFTYTMANQIGVLGHVCNLGDGTVEIFAEAKDLNMEQFIAYVRQGPTYARVDELKVQELKDAGNYSRFNFR